METNKQIIYLDNNATTPIDKKGVWVVKEH